MAIINKKKQIVDIFVVKWRFLSFKIFLGRIKQAVKSQRKEALSAFKEYCYILKVMGFFKAAVKCPTEAERAVK